MTKNETLITVLPCTKQLLGCKLLKNSTDYDRHIINRRRGRLNVNYKKKKVSENDILLPCQLIHFIIVSK